MAASRRASARRCWKARYYNNDGQLVTGSMMDYTMPRAHDLPSFKVDHDRRPNRPSNPLGMKGCGEAGAIASPAAVINAITDAIGTERHRHAGDRQVRCGRPCRNHRRRKPLNETTR